MTRTHVAAAAAAAESMCVACGNSFAAVAYGQLHDQLEPASPVATCNSSHFICGASMGAVR